MRRRTVLSGLASSLLVAPGIARADEVHVSSYGALMYGAPYTVAIRKGFFKDAGADVTGVVSAKGGGTTVRNIFAGGMPYGEVSLSAAVAAVAAGLDLRIVNTGVRTAADFVWVTMGDSPVRTAQDLIGKRIAMTEPKSISEMLLIMCLSAAGLDPARVQRVALGGVGPGLTALEKGAVQAAPIIEPILSARPGRYRTVFTAKDLLKPMTQSVSVASTDLVKQQPALLRAIIEGRRSGVRFIYAEPKETAAILSDAYDNLPRDVAERAVANLVPLNYWSEGAFEIAAMNEAVRGLKIIGQIDADPDWSKLIDPSFLPADLKRGA